MSAYQFQSLWSLLLPPPLHFLLWMVAQPDDFFQPPPSPTTPLPPAAAAAAAAHGLGDSGVDLQGAGGSAGSLESHGSDDRSAGSAGSSGGGGGQTSRSGGRRHDCGGGSGVVALWPLICEELGLTPEQKDRVRQVQRQLRRNQQAAAEQRALALLAGHLGRLHTVRRGPRRGKKGGGVLCGPKGLRVPALSFHFFGGATARATAAKKKAHLRSPSLRVPSLFFAGGMLSASARRCEEARRRRSGGGTGSGRCSRPPR